MLTMSNQIGYIDYWTIRKVEVDVLKVSNGIQEGIIERSDLSYFRLEEDLTQHFKFGQKIKAMVLDAPASGPLILGVKQVENPCWKKFSQQRKIGYKVYGHVLRVHNKEGALVQIENTGGVIGRMPPEESIDMGEGDVALLAGDRVRAVIINFDHDHKCAILSLQRLIQSKDEWKGSSTISIGELAGDELQLLSFRLGLYGQHSFSSAINKLKNKNIHTIFFCDDDKHVCETYRKSFEIAGFQVITAFGGHDGIEQGLLSDFDLAIIDLHMTDTDGCEVARAIKRAKPEVDIIIVSGINNYQKHGYGDKLQQFGLLNSIIRKPFTLNDIANKLEKIKNKIAEEENNATLIDFISQTIEDTFNLENTLSAVLETIRAKTKADTVCVFSSHIIDPRIELVVRSGDFPLDFNEEVLNRSPIKDVIIEDHDLNTFEISEDAYQHGNYYTNLYNIYPCRSLMARSLRVSGDKRYALFIMSKAPKKEWYKYRILMSALAEVVATAIERKRLEEIFVRHQKFYIIGQISSSLIHELKNEEQIVSNSIHQLAHLAYKVSRDDDDLSYIDERFKAGFHYAVDTLVEYNERIGRIQNLFLTFRHHQEIEKVDINQHVELLCETLQPYARDQGVELIYSEDATESPSVQINLAYLNQILTNLIMNSVEQTKRVRSADGKVKVSCQVEYGDKRCIKIRIRDNGPGVHDTYRTRIFDLLFTSKPKGMGMGLYISRAFAKALNADLRIEYTCRFDGTIMVIELPF